jgi:hypothetical protein
MEALSDSQKKLYWFSTFGEISVTEQTYIDKQDGKLRRPFQASAQIRCRGYSRPLQRAITDFGADDAFGRVAKKLREHYGITLAGNAILTITERHARAITAIDVMPTLRPSAVPLTLVAEVDGSMIPIVETTAGTDGLTDRRKTRKLLWKEAKLALVRRANEVDPVIAVTLGDPASSGEALKQLAQAVGFAADSRVHGLGDGAPWIAEQMEFQFGLQAGYLLDFYHLCDYLSAAATVCDKENPGAWMTLQKEQLKTGHLSEVIRTLRPFVEPDVIPSEEAPVRQCYRYIINRPGQFKYLEALAANLPIGSGEVESAHRYVIQKRLKLAGAWWSKDNAQAMLNLRAVRANGCWDRYWDAIAA